MNRTWIASLALLTACGAAEPRGPRSAPVAAPGDTDHAAGDAVAVPSPSSAPTTSSSASSAAPPVALRVDARWKVERLLDANVFFLITGEDGRIAALADDGGTVMPHRYERGAWQAIALPTAEKTSPAASALGIYFGRDNRLRLMGHREAATGRKMVYLRHRDGIWQDQRSEIGALAGDSSQLYGVLGEADPEVVCKLGGICLLKSRKGWKELANTIPPTSVVREFGGKGWALTSEGVFRADDAGFTRVGPPASWKSPATGFWVGSDGSVAVAEPAANAIHRLDAGATSWTAEVSPISGPRDVHGPRADRWVAGDGGLAHGDGAAVQRVGEASLRLVRWIPTKEGAVAGGASGVFGVQAAR